MAELSLLFTGAIIAILIRGVAQGLQARYAARCSREVRSEVRHSINRCWQASGPVSMSQTSAGTWRENGLTTPTPCMGISPVSCPR